VVLAGLAAGCVTMAAPPPLPTFGGPATAARGADEVALALGGGASLFPGAHSGGNGWFTRWRRGVSDTWDVGVDVLGVQHSNLETLTTKLAFRHRLGPRLRIEGGVGAADDSNGKALNADIGITAGRLRPESEWSRYVSLRVAVAHGYPGNVLGLGTSADRVAPPDDLIGIGAIGTSGRIGSQAHFVFEGGYGGIAVRGHSGLGRAFYLGAGLLFQIGGPHALSSHP
jgi:hypothetical protein